jgi:hypothetical protein
VYPIPPIGSRRSSRPDNSYFDHPMNLAPNIRQNNFQGSWNVPMNNVSFNF